VTVAKVQDHSIIKTNNFNTMETNVNYKLFDCQEGKCVQTQGYVMKDNNNIYAFVGTEVGEKISRNAIFLGNPAIVKDTDTNAIKECTAAYNGKIYVYTGNAGMCITGSETTHVGINFGLVQGNIKYSMILKGTAAKGTPFEDANYNIAIKSHSEYIVRDQFLSSGN